MSRFPGFPHQGFPEGWFGIGWGDEFPPGKVVALRYFGEDLVAWRTDDGRLVVMDAYCPHMGAHLGVGGRVDGDCIVCPFHGWSWHADGHNAGIPYAKRANSRAKIGTWSVVERGPMALIWFSWRSRQPTWDPPDFEAVAAPDVFWDPAASRRSWSNIRVVPQMVAENIVDGPHIHFVHLAAERAHIARLEERQSVFDVELDQTYMARSGPVLGKDFIQSVGLGIQTARMEFKDLRVINVLMTTPVEEDRSDMRASIFLTLPPGVSRPANAAELSERLQNTIKAHLDSQEQDLPIWQAMRYQPQPLLAGEEVQGHVRFRKWAAQFYASANSQGT